MHPITVRTMAFDIPQVSDFEPKWLANNIQISYLASGLSLYVAHLEPFLIKSMRRVLDQVEDVKLKEDVDRFCRQEAQHYSQHRRFNDAILGSGYPGLQERYEKLEAEFNHFFLTRGNRWCIGFAEGFESYTTQGALGLLQSGALRHAATDQRFGRLFEWHLAEELEHRTVAFDIYQYLYGDYGFRVKMCFIAQTHIWRFLMDCMTIMSTVDAQRYDASYRVSKPARIVLTAGVMPLFLKTYMPWYSPAKLQIPDRLQHLSEQLSESAESTY